jgi:hypothetical protein
MLEALPAAIQAIAEKAFHQFCKDRTHPSLDLKPIHDSGSGRHRAGSFRVKVTARYRAVFVPDGGKDVWYFVGSHADYNALIGIK